MDELGINHDVTFFEYLSKKDWHTLFVNYDSYLNTTNFDNIAVTVVEAMALGLPVNSTNVGEILFLIDNDNYGLLIGRGDCSGMIENIVRVINNTEKGKELALIARRKA